MRTLFVLSLLTLPVQAQQTYNLVFSTSSNRSAPAPLNGQTVSGGIYVFTSPDADVARVSFFFDNPTMQGSPTRIESGAPYDFRGGNVATANPFRTNDVSDGAHSIAARLELSGGGVANVLATFMVDNDAPPTQGDFDLYFSLQSNRSSPTELDAATVEDNIYVFTQPVAGATRVQFFIDDPGFLSPPHRTETSAPFDLMGGTVATARALNTQNLSDGPHTVSARITHTGGQSVAHASFQVANDVPPQATLVFAPTSIALSLGADGVASRQATVTTSNGTMVAPSFSVSPGAPWLSLSGGGTTPVVLGLNIDATGLAPGNHSATVNATAPGYAGGSLGIQLTIVPKALAFSPSSVGFVINQGDSSSTEVVLDTNNGRTPAVTVTESAPWLMASPLSGNAPLTIDLDADTLGLAPGQYSTMVTASAAGFPNAVLNVTLTVGGATGSVDFFVSLSPQRTAPMPLDGELLTGGAYVFTSPDTGVDRVSFFVDDPSFSGSADRVENSPPYDLAGTETDGTAKPYDTNQIADGMHTLSARILNDDGTTSLVHSSFSVLNDVTGLVFTPSTLVRTVNNPGDMASAAVMVSAEDDSSVMFDIVENAGWLEVTPLLATTPFVLNFDFDSSGLPNGTYMTTVGATAPGYAPGMIEVTLHVGNPHCSPLECSQLLVSLPYVLDFEVDRGLILDDNGFGTGFTYVQPTSHGAGYLPNLFTVDEQAGVLNLITTRGIQVQAVNTADNVLGVGLDIPSQVTVLSTTLINPPPGSGNSEQAGLWFGTDEDNYIKLVVQSAASTTRIQGQLEVDRATVVTNNDTFADLSNSTVELTLKIDPYIRTVTAQYRVNSGTLVTLGVYSPPEEFFSFDAAGIDPAIGTRSFGGIFATHRNSSTPLVYSFGGFSADVGTSVTASGFVDFERTEIAVNNPTSMVWGPDNRLYVASVLGAVTAFTLDADNQVLAQETIETLNDAMGNRLLLGLALDPSSTPGNVALYLAHSNGSQTAGQLNSGMVSRISGPGFATIQHVITGLPRAIANHSINSIHFGPDNRLYIAMGGNTGAGSANLAQTEFGDRAEQPLSAALLVADIFAPGFDGTCANLSDPYGPAPCSVVPYATGLRNTYDFVFHSNGSIYGPDNGLGVTGTFPPTPFAPCTGFGDPAPVSEGGHNPGQQPDPLNRIVAGMYYGQPNPSRGECVYQDGSLQGVAPLPNYLPPIYNLGDHRSANGIVEYPFNVGCVQMQGDLLISNYSVGDDITRIRLTPDGMSVDTAQSLVGGLNNPLPLLINPSGTIFVGEFGPDRVSALIPRSLGCWSELADSPVNLLDPGSAAVNGLLYVVGGKTGSAHQSALYSYNPATDTWTTLSAPMPGVAVENPAAVGLNGKLYVFGGSTGPFSGAVPDARVYDPSSGGWTALTPMNAARGGATAKVLGTKIYVVGGLDVDGASLDTMEIYDPATNSWMDGPSMAVRRDNAGSAAINGKLYVFGGRTREASGMEVNGTLNSLEEFDPSTNQWTTKANMPTGRRTMSVGTLNGRIQVIGGERTASGGTFEVNEEYDPATDTWRALQGRNPGRHGAAFATIGDTLYIAVGGVTGGTSTSNLLEAFVF